MEPPPGISPAPRVSPSCSSGRHSTVASKPVPNPAMVNVPPIRSCWRGCRTSMRRTTIYLLLPSATRRTPRWCAASAPRPRTEKCLVPGGSGCGKGPPTASPDRQHDEEVQGRRCENSSPPTGIPHAQLTAPVGEPADHALGRCRGGLTTTEPDPDSRTLEWSDHAAVSAAVEGQELDRGPVTERGVPPGGLEGGPRSPPRSPTRGRPCCPTPAGRALRAAGSTRRTGSCRCRRWRRPAYRS